ncbi:MAG: acyloxyacyl hydrolase [Urechidicola sp.]|nr:acyloxyacyl hydrolase [Urechidicola sp.]
MKQYLYIVFIFSSFFVYSQEDKNAIYIEFDYFYGNIIEHAPELKPIIQAHPTGFILSWNKKKLENSKFERSFNYPDFGFTASYQNFHNDVLGEVYSLYAHYNFYLLNRNFKNQLKLTSGFGLGYATTPFDKESNSKNWAIGSKFVASAYLKLMYERQYLIDNFGVNGGVTMLHYSNGSFNVPNLGINTVAASVGVNYNFDEQKTAPERALESAYEKNKIRFGGTFRFGFNESLINDSGLFPFYTISAFAEKQLSYTSTVSLGSDLFLSTFMKDYIEWNNLQEGTANETSDWKRVGIFVGYELNMDKFSVLGQVGYNVYYPYDYVSRIYERFGFRKHFGEHLFADLTLKINLFRAEGLEFGLGYRF